jgi:4-hydroxybenzoate polyprenyltransferase
MDSSHHPQHIADAHSNNWVERYLPSQALPYAQLMRLDRPIGWWLLLLPCWWSLALASIHSGASLPNLWHALLFCLGAIIMRGAGCVLNDLADKNFDAKVERTKSRPLPSGRVSTKAAIYFLGLLLCIGLAVLLQFNTSTVLWALASLVIVAIYPFMKRITYYPQFVLGLAFNWGALLGWTATRAEMAVAPIMLYAGGIFWTLAYDTIYAHQDKEDDIQIGVKSTALKFGAQTVYWLVAFFGSAIVMFALALFHANASWISYLALAGTATHAAWQIKCFDGNNSDLCLKLFKSNRTFGLIFLFGLLLDCLTP